VYRPWENKAGYLLTKNKFHSLQTFAIFFFIWGFTQNRAMVEKGVKKLP
jgi:hypothetical protein